MFFCISDHGMYKFHPLAPMGMSKTSLHPVCREMGEALLMAEAGRFCKVVVRNLTLNIKLCRIKLCGVVVYTNTFLRGNLCG